MRTLLLTIWTAVVAATFVGCNSLDKNGETDDSQTIQLIRNEPYSDSEEGIEAQIVANNSNSDASATSINPSELDARTIQQIEDLIQTTNDPALREFLQQTLEPPSRAVGARLSDAPAQGDSQSQQPTGNSEVFLDETAMQESPNATSMSPDSQFVGSPRNQHRLPPESASNDPRGMTGRATDSTGIPSINVSDRPNQNVEHPESRHNGQVAMSPRSQANQAYRPSNGMHYRDNGTLQRDASTGIEQQRQLERQMGEQMLRQLGNAQQLPNMGFEGQQVGFPNTQSSPQSWLTPQIPAYDTNESLRGFEGSQLRYDEAVIPNGRNANGIAQANLVEPVEPGRWKENLRKTIETLEATRLLKTEQMGPSQVARNELTLRFLYLLSGERDKALQPVAEMGEAEQAYWEQQLFAMSELMSSTELDLNSPFFASNARLNAIAAQHQRKALGHLSDMAMLQIRNASFCRSINGFGSFEEFTSKTFQSGQEVLIYCELENLSALESAGANYQVFESELQASIEVFDSQRRVVKRLDFDIVRDVGRNRRLDFYVHFGWKIPTDLPPGDYYLRITVEDLVGDKATANSTPLEFHIPDKAN